MNIYLYQIFSNNKIKFGEYVNYSSTEMDFKIVGISEFNVISYDFEIFTYVLKDVNNSF